MMNNVLVVLATILHLIPHPFGVSPVGGLALYSGALGNTRSFWIAPLVPLTVAAFLTGIYDLTVMAFVFAGFALSALIGRILLGKTRSPVRYGTAIVAAATVFFLISNFAIWLVGYYPQTAAGLVACYLNGLPYLGQAMLADAAFCFLLFGLHSAIERHQPVVQTA